jgi:prepilin-type N-terminal cleavage/methylation domain-containing protein
VLTSPDDRRRRTEAGFTLIELVLAMAIAAVVLSISTVAVMAVFGTSSQSQATRIALGNASDVFEQFDRDVRYARSPLNASSVMSREELRSLLLDPAQSPAACSQSIAVANSQFCLFEEITQASPTELWLRTDTLTTAAEHAGVECVVWRVSEAGLVRSVHQAGPEPDCRRIGTTERTGTLIEQRTMLPPIPQGGDGNDEDRAASFGYAVALNPTTTVDDGGDTVTDCETNVDFDSPLTGRQRTFITRITMDLSAYGTYGSNAASRDRMTVSSTPITRASDSFAFAGGCAL